MTYHRLFISSVQSEFATNLDENALSFAENALSSGQNALSLLRPISMEKMRNPNQKYVTTAGVV